MLCSFRTIVYNNGTLRIGQVRRSDEGTYICEGVGPDGVSQSFIADLEIASKSISTRVSVSGKGYHYQITALALV